MSDRFIPLSIKGTASNDRQYLGCGFKLIEHDHPSMDSLAQDLTGATTDRLPRQEIRSCSLVAKD